MLWTSKDLAKVCGVEEADLANAICEQAFGDLSLSIENKGVSAKAKAGDQKTKVRKIAYPFTSAEFTCFLDSLEQEVKGMLLQENRNEYSDFLVRDDIGDIGLIMKTPQLKPARKHSSPTWLDWESLLYL